MDADKLITLVRGKPPLWDKSINEYKDKKVKKKCWLEIVQEIIQNWEQLDKPERNRRLKEVKGTWQFIRDKFMKCLNAERNGAPGRKRKKYLYADALDFIRNSAETRSTSGNTYDLEEDEDNSPSPSQPTPHDYPSQSTLPHTITSPFQNPTTSTTQNTNFKRSPPKKSKHRSFQKQLQQNLQPTNENDADTAYLMSLVPIYKSLTDLQKLEFQQMSVHFMLSVKRGHHRIPQSPYLRSPSPTPYRRSPTPYRRSLSPYRRSPTPYRRSLSPYRRSSPYRNPPFPCGSPVHYDSSHSPQQSPHEYRSSSSAEYSPAPSP